MDKFKTDLAIFKKEGSKIHKIQKELVGTKEKTKDFSHVKK